MVAVRANGASSGIRQCIFCVMVLMLVASACATRPTYYEDDFFGRDKIHHFAACAIIGGGTCAAARNNNVSLANPPILGISTAVAVGIGKEWYDLEVRETFWSWKDLIWDVAGGAAGAYVVTLGD